MLELICNRSTSKNDTLNYLINNTIMTYNIYFGLIKHLDFFCI